MQFNKEDFVIRLSMRSSILFITGFMTMFHLVTLFPYIIYAAVIVGLACICLISYSGLLQGRICGAMQKYIAWYGFFTLFVVDSLLYSVNIINPDYVLKRVLVIFALGFIVASTVKREDDFKQLANGLIVGAIVVAVVALLNEVGRVGVGRIGGKTTGSSVALSGIMLVGIICSLWRCIFFKKSRVLFGSASAFQFFMIFLTGSRRAILLSVFFLLVFFLFNHSINKNKKWLIILLSCMGLVAALYYVLTNDVLYNFVGWRLESMLSSFMSDSNIVEDASMRERGIMKAYAMQLFSEKPILGYGVHGFAYMFREYYGKLLYSHAGFVEILSCYGIVGFVIFYAIFLWIFRKIKLIFSYVEPWEMLLIVYAIVTFMTEGYTIAFITPQVIVMLTASCCMLTHRQHDPQDRKE